MMDELMGHPLSAIIAEAVKRYRQEVLAKTKERGYYGNEKRESRRRYRK